MHKVLDEDTIKTKILPPNCLWQNVGMFQKATWRKLFHTFSTSRKPLVDGLLRLRFHDVVLVGREQHAPQPLRVGCCKRTSFRCRCPLARACNIIIFVKFSV